MIQVGDKVRIRDWSYTATITPNGLRHEKPPGFGQDEYTVVAHNAIIRLPMFQYGKICYSVNSLGGRERLNDTIVRHDKTGTIIFICWAFLDSVETYEIVVRKTNTAAYTTSLVTKEQYNKIQRIIKENS